MKKLIIIHPFIFGLFPIFFIYSQRKETPLASVLIAAVILPSVILGIWLLLGLVIRDKEKRGVGLSVFLLFFFSFGYGYKTAREFLPGSIETGYYLFWVLWLLWLIISLIVLTKFKRGLGKFNLSLNVMGVVLIFFLLFDFFPPGEWFGPPDFQPVDIKAALPQIPPKERIGLKAFPNIYYIILDAYGRADILKEYYQFDNREFINFLKVEGFFVAEKSRANYPQTALSLASSLNFHYLDQMFEKIDTESESRGPLAELIRNNLLFDFLKQFHYSIITISSGKSETEITREAQYLSPRWSFSDFQNLLLSTTPLPLILRGAQYASHRERILFSLKELKKIPKEKPPFLTFAHIICPHPPFVFGASGEPLTPKRNFSFLDGDHFIRYASRAEYVENYRKAMTFLNKKLIEVVQTILADSADPPIIILQSDHGPGSYLDWGYPEQTNFRERMDNFIACYFPDRNYKNCYPGITPVNLFRIVLNQFFGTHLELLGDEIYFSEVTHPYKFIKVTDKTD